MSERTYDEWKAREEDYRRQRRKRSRSSRLKARARYLWDAATPPLRFDHLIPQWQHAVMAFVASPVVDVQDCWEQVRPSIHSRWQRLPSTWQAALWEVADGKS